MSATSQESTNCVGDKVYNVSDFFDEQRKQGREIGSITTIWPRWFALRVEHYDNEQEIVSVEFHVRIRRIDSVRHDFCAVLYFPPISEKFDLSVGGGVADESYVAFSGASENKMQKPVFIEVIQVSKNGEEWRQILMNPVVWLRSLNSCPHMRTEFLKSTRFLAPKVIDAATEGESELTLIGGRIFPRFVNGNRVHKMVERGAEIVDCICDNERPSFERRLNANVGDQTIPARISVYLSRDEIGAAVSPNLDFILDGLSVFVGAPDFGEDAFKVNSHGPDSTP
jgi:hypothetical protein